MPQSNWVQKLSSTAPKGHAYLIFQNLESTYYRFRQLHCRYSHPRVQLSQTGLLYCLLRKLFPLFLYRMFGYNFVVHYLHYKMRLKVFNIKTAGCFEIIIDFSDIRRYLRRTMVIFGIIKCNSILSVLVQNSKRGSTLSVSVPVNKCGLEVLCSVSVNGCVSVPVVKYEPKLLVLILYKMACPVLSVFSTGYSLPLLNNRCWIL